MANEKYEAVILGSGFGGAITGCRLACKWPGKRVLVLERGKRYGLGGFPRAPHDFARNFWALSGEKIPRPPHIRKALRTEKVGFRGMFNVRNYEHMDVVIGAWEAARSFTPTSFSCPRIRYLISAGRAPARRAPCCPITR